MNPIRTLWRRLSLPWKVAIPPLVMVLIFTPPVFAIVHDVSSKAENDLRQRLEQRGGEAGSSVLQQEFYALESVRLASNIQGLAPAVQSGNIAGVREGYASVLAFKDRLDLLVATDVRGRPLVEFERVGSKFVQHHTRDWTKDAFLKVAVGQHESAEFVRTTKQAILAVAAPIRVNKSVVGVAIAGLRAQTIADIAAKQAGLAISLFDNAGTRVAASGDLAPPKTHTAAVPIFSKETIAATDAAVLGKPLEVAGRRVGSVDVAVPRAPFFSLANRVTRNLELLIGFAVAVGLVLLVLLTRFLLAQIRQLKRVNEQLRAKDLTARAEVLSEDDLGQVALGLNEMADELQHSYATLERRVDERTRDLRKARDVAERATRAKADFLASMSHEVRTPMNAVIGMTSLLLDEDLSPKLRSYVETIRGSGEHLLTIINDILDFSKIEAGRLELELHPFGIGKCIEEAMDLVVQRAKEQGTELAYKIEPGTPEAIIGDMGRLRQVLLNLISNAVKFTEGGEVVVTVRSKRTKEKRREFEFSVRDTGIGIPRNRLNSVFAAFEQVDASTTRRSDGTGLGLAISKHLVDLMGGRVWVDSKLGKGSTFSFTISAEPTELPKEQKFVPAPELDGRACLIVDDNETNRLIASGYVERWGMTATAVPRPLDALELFRKNDYDVVLLDEQMPEMSGTELSAEMKKLRRKVPLLLLSSVQPDVAGQARRRFAAMLSKPIKPSQLHDAMQNVFARAAPVEPAETHAELDQEMGSRHPLRILVAEDNAINQRVMQAILERLGYQADLASNGLEAVNGVTRQQYDVVLMDVSMPEMDGLQATKEIVKRPGARPRIIAMTAYATAEDRRKCLDAGMDDYMSKPVTAEKLTKALERSDAVDYSKPRVAKKPHTGRRAKAKR